MVLISELFTPAKATKVAGFNCGTAPWEEYLNKWIIGNGAVESLKRGSDVLLYYEGDMLVGFGSVGETRISYPWPTGQKQKVSIVPAIALAVAFQGKPPGVPDEEKFAWQIMSDLTARAVRLGNDKLVLHVHRLNTKALRFYDKFGFKTAGESHEADHLLMILKLTNLLPRQDSGANT